MTKQDYEVIADAIRAEVEDAMYTFDAILHVQQIAENLARAFKRDNPNFNRAVFMDRALGYCPDPSTDYVLLEANSR